MRASSAAMLSDCGGGTTGSSRPCSSSTGQAAVGDVAHRGRAPGTRSRSPASARSARRGSATRSRASLAAKSRRSRDAVVGGGGAEHRAPRGAVVTAHSAVQPPAEPPRMASRLRSASPALASATAAAIGVLDVDDAPLPPQPLAVQAAVAGRAAVVHVDDADAAAGEIRLLQVEQRRSSARSGPPCTQTTYGGSSPAGAVTSGLAGRVHQGVHRAPERPLQLACARHRQVRRVGDVTELPAQHRRLAGGGVDARRPTAGSLARPRRPRSTSRRRTARREVGVRHVQVGQLGCLRVEHARAAGRPARAAPRAGRRRAPRTAARRAARAARRTPPRPGRAPAAARRSARPGRGSTSRASRRPRTGWSSSRQAGREHRFPQPALDQPALAGDAVVDRPPPAARCRPRACADGSSRSRPGGRRPGTASGTRRSPRR